MSAPQRYPLAWPHGRPRKRQRKPGQFSFKEDTVYGPRTRTITIERACERVERQVDKLGGAYPLLSSNLELRVDGRPRADRPAPADPGVALYFTIRGEPYTIACDTYTTVAQNIAAIAAHIEASRRIAAYGVATAEETLQNFRALPPPAPKATPWWTILELPEDILKRLKPEMARTVIDGAYRALATKAHPDAGGSSEAMAELNRAKEQALASIAPLAVQ